MEQKLSSLVDLEGDELDLDLDEDLAAGGEPGADNSRSPSPGAEDVSSSSFPLSMTGVGSGGLQRRRGTGAARTSPSKTATAQVISDLERMGVKPSPVVSRAVTLIDSWTLLTGRLHVIFYINFIFS